MASEEAPLAPTTSAAAAKPSTSAAAAKPSVVSSVAPPSGNDSGNAMLLVHVAQRARAEKQLGNRLFGQKLFADALKAYASVLELEQHLDSDDVATLAAGSAVDVDEVRTLVLTCRLNSAQCALSLKQFSLAKEHAEAVLAADEDNVKALYRLGMAEVGGGFVWVPTDRGDFVCLLQYTQPAPKMKTRTQHCLRTKYLILHGFVLLAPSPSLGLPAADLPIQPPHARTAISPTLVHSLSHSFTPSPRPLLPVHISVRWCHSLGWVGGV